MSPLGSAIALLPNMKQRTYLSLSCAVLLLACAPLSPDEMASLEKGEEDTFMVDGRADSFASPTDHGRITFGAAVDAELGDGARFHAFTFALRGEAEINIDVTSADPNLDTVAYLYYRFPGESDWGRYISRNDDADSTRVTSQIARLLSPGEYRVIVKAFKYVQRGPFSLTVSCDGECATTASEMAIPTPTGFGDRCAYLLEGVFKSELLNVRRSQVPLAEIASQDRFMRVAAAHYARKFATDLEWYAVSELPATTRVLEDGVIITLDQPDSDETAMTYVFDKTDGLIASHWDIPEPDIDYYCAGLGGTWGAPNEECVAALLSTSPHDVAEEREAQVTVSSLSELDEAGDPFVAAAASAYVERILDGDFASEGELTIDAVTWGEGAEVMVTGARSGAAVYTLARDGSRLFVVFENYEGHDEVDFACVL